MYGKVFAQIYDGSLHGHWQAIVTLHQLVALSDLRGVVRSTPEELARRTAIPVEVLTAGLARLTTPDPGARRTEDGGRHVAETAEGWRILDRRLLAPPRRPAIPAHVRRAVFARDGHCCVSCGASGLLEVDHIVPWSAGGGDEPENLQTLCRDCNRAKGCRLQWTGRN